MQDKVCITHFAPSSPKHNGLWPDRKKKEKADILAEKKKNNFNQQNGHTKNKSKGKDKSHTGKHKEVESNHESPVQNDSASSSSKKGSFLSKSNVPAIKSLPDFSIKSHTQQGNDELHRTENQDRHVFQYDTARGLLWLGVFDGHSGSAAAQFVSTNLVPCISSMLKERGQFTVEELKVAIRSGIIETENQFRQLDEPDGVCVLLACLSGLEMVVANVGDSRAVLGSYKQGSTSALCSRLLTNDHNASNAVEAKLARFRFLQNNQILPPTARPEDYSEQELIEKVKEVMEGMDIISNGRLLTVQLTRSIGDFGLKKYCFNVVSNEPEFTVVRLSEEDRLLILASDGVWATVTADDAVNIVMDRLLNLAAFYDVGPAEALVQEAVRRGSGDDQTALILDLKKYKRCVKWNAEKKGLPDPENGESPLAAAIRKGLFLSDRSCGSPSLLYGSASRAFSAKMARLHARGSFIGSTDVGIFEQQAKEAQPLASSAHSVRNKLKGAAAPAPILGLFEQTAIEGTKAREMEKKKNDFHFRSYRC